ncbi:protein of unknown function [Methanoculleus bourgensis]|uniref:Uncharacterized protein n=1 Tax=Methanoculleus bourgensis TaxID=83986 RepID=A0A0X3BN20_9EURY|nr:protein of unknown function [Methanoculleus bourgensis]
MAALRHEVGAGEGARPLSLKGAMLARDGTEPGFSHCPNPYSSRRLKASREATSCNILERTSSHPVRPVFRRVITQRAVSLQKGGSAQKLVSHGENRATKKGLV